MPKSKKTITRITIDHQPFLSVVKVLRKRSGGKVPARSLGVMIRADEYNTIMEHGKWFEKFSQQRRKASASRTSHGPQRKPNSEVSRHALYMRKRRDAKKDRS